MRIAALLVAALAATLLPAIAAAGVFAPHRALYEMTLRSSERDSGIVSVRGEMLADWGETCEGWTLEHRSSVDIEVGGESPLRVTTAVTTWESRDGLTYRFSVRNTERDGSEERIEGTARLDGPGQGGTVRYEKPEARSQSLPPGTIFPTAHSEEVLAAAGDNPVSFRRVVFDGMSDDGLFEVNAVIGVANPAGPPLREASKPLEGLKSWPTHIAFYRHGSADAVPDNEIIFRMYENGVSDDMTIDFGRFKVLARLKALELSPRPSCPGR